MRTYNPRNMVVHNGILSVIRFDYYHGDNWEVDDVYRCERCGEIIKVEKHKKYIQTSDAIVHVSTFKCSCKGGE